MNLSSARRSLSAIRRRLHLSMRLSIVPPFLLFLVLTQSLPSQETPPSLSDCPRQEHGGVIKGRVLNDSTGRPVHPRGVMLVGTACFAITDAAGAFTFQPIRAGQYFVKAGDLGYRRFHPIQVELVSDTTVEVEIRLRPENLLADCLEVSHCRVLLEQPIDTSLSMTEALRELAFRLTIALTAGQEDSVPTWTA